MTPETTAWQPEMVHARVYTFHVTSEQLDDVSTALDHAVADLSRHSDFRGLLYLERGDTRHEVLGVTLWAGNGIDETEQNAEHRRQMIAELADSGVHGRNYRVLRHFRHQSAVPVFGRWGPSPMADVG